MYNPINHTMTHRFRGDRYQRGGKKKTKPTPDIVVTKDLEASVTYTPIVYLVPDSKDSIFDYKIDPIFSTNMPVPQFTLGLTFYAHATKDKMEIIPTLSTKRKFYYIVNPFEHLIDGAADKSIATYATKYLDIPERPEILSRGFFKLWEMMLTFDLIPTNTSDFVSAHLAEGPGAFLQATMYYRDLFIEKKYTTKNDKYYAITLHDETDGKHVPQLEKKFIDIVSKEKPQRVVIHKTASIKDLQKGGKADNGDLTKIKTINHFGGNFKTRKADFITGDGGINWQDENTQEQESFMLIFGEICTALDIQEKGGNYVLKLFESFTNPVCKLIVILKEFYEKVYIIKPLMSRASNSEKYLVCEKYKGYNQKKVETMKNLLKQMNTTKLVLFDYFPDYEFEKTTLAMLRAMNTEIQGRQFEIINKMITYIEQQDYYGTAYRKFQDVQIKSSEYWISMYFPENLDRSLSLLKTTVKKSLVDSEFRTQTALRF